LKKASEIKIACIQMKPEIGDVEGNVKHSIENIESAVKQGANFIVLPELCNTGYVFNTREEAFSLAESVPDGKTTEQWIKVAKGKNIYIVAGITERDGDVLYNSAVFVGPDGFIGKYRKNHLWYEEKLFFEPGNLGFPIFNTKVGKVGILICYDMWFPEGFRYYGSKNVDLVCVATNWVPMPNQPKGQMQMANHIAMVNAHCNGFFVACADRVGVERSQPFVGSSIIVNSTGWPVSGPASYENEETILASIDLSESRECKTINNLNNSLSDRRPEIY
jgi:Predicted amidohydrolase